MRVVGQGHFDINRREENNIHVALTVLALPFRKSLMTVQPDRHHLSRPAENYDQWCSAFDVLLTLSVRLSSVHQAFFRILIGNTRP